MFPLAKRSPISATAELLYSLQLVTPCVVQAEIRRRRDMESERLKALPDWKRHLLIKRREHDAA